MSIILHFLRPRRPGRVVLDKAEATGTLRGAVR